MRATAHMSETPMRRDTAEGAVLRTTPAGAVNEGVRATTELSISLRKLIEIAGARGGFKRGIVSVTLFGQRQAHRALQLLHTDRLQPRSRTLRTFRSLIPLSNFSSPFFLLHARKEIKIVRHSKRLLSVQPVHKHLTTYRRGTSECVRMWLPASISQILCDRACRCSLGLALARGSLHICNT